jgi:hypothetical protein
MPMDRLHHLNVRPCALLNREAAWWTRALLASGSDTEVTEWKSDEYVKDSSSLRHQLMRDKRPARQHMHDALSHMPAVCLPFVKYTSPQARTPL